jgi:hypothetical protein
LEYKCPQSSLSIITYGDQPITRQQVFCCHPMLKYPSKACLEHPNLFTVKDGARY